MRAYVGCRDCFGFRGFEAGSIPEQMWELELMGPGFSHVEAASASAPHKDVVVRGLDSGIAWAFPAELRSVTPADVNAAAEVIARIPENVKSAFINWWSSWTGRYSTQCHDLTQEDVTAFIVRRESEHAAAVQQEQDTAAAEAADDARKRDEDRARGKTPVDVDEMLRRLGIDPERVRLHQLGETTTAEWAPEFRILKRMIAALHSAMNRGAVETTLIPEDEWKDLDDAANTRSRDATIAVMSTGGAWSNRAYNGAVTVDLHRDEWGSVGIYAAGPGHINVTSRDREDEDVAVFTTFSGESVGRLLVEVWKQRQWMRAVMRGFLAQPERSIPAPAETAIHEVRQLLDTALFLETQNGTSAASDAIGAALDKAGFIAAMKTGPSVLDQLDRARTKAARLEPEDWAEMLPLIEAAMTAVAPSVSYGNPA